LSRDIPLLKQVFSGNKSISGYFRQAWTSSPVQKKTGSPDWQTGAVTGPEKYWFFRGLGRGSDPDPARENTLSPTVFSVEESGSVAGIWPRERE
jgi:hypothetical protein